MNIVILNGWAMPACVLNEICERLEALTLCTCIRVIDIDRSLTAKQWVQYLDESIIENTLLIGWSLGGMLAVEYAHEYPEKLRGLCTLQMNPKFIAATDWSCAMSMDTFSEFKQLAAYDAKTMVKRFGFLVTAKGDDALSDFKQLKRTFVAGTLPSTEVLQRGLELLETVDVRNKLSELALPQLHIYGEQDQLVPNEVKKQMELLSGQTNVTLLAGMSHLPCYGSAQSVVDLIHEFAGGLS